MVAVTTGMLVVFALVAVALALFVTEAIPSDIVAVGVLVSLAVLEPYTGVDSTNAIAGFASPAVVTILAMYILSEGVQETGVVERLGVWLSTVTRGDSRRLLAATVGTTGVSAGIINNTPVVAVFIPMVNGLAERAGVSRSKLLLPLSYAAMLGGTLTLVGTATNLLASDLSAELLDHPIGMFEFTPLGIVVFAVGFAYLVTVGWRLTPERIPASGRVSDRFDLEENLYRFVVRKRSPLVGVSVREARDLVNEAADLDDDGTADVDLLVLQRENEPTLASTSDREIERGDVITVRATGLGARWFARNYDCRRFRRSDIDEAKLVDERSRIVEAFVPTESRLVGDTVGESNLPSQFNTTVLAIRRGDGELVREGLSDQRFRAGDTLLIQTTHDDVAYLDDAGTLLVTHESVDSFEEDEEGAAKPERPPLAPETPVALGIMVAVVALAALDVVPIVISALGGVVAMVVTGCLTTADAYDAVSWNVVFLLAGVLPLGVAMQNTQGDQLIAELLVGSASVLPDVVVLGLFYLLAGVLANVITPVASVVLMVPIAVDTANRIGANAFAFVLAVTFAGSSAFMTPIGYQTNLMVYGPGGYRFTDYLRVGAPLQALLSVVVTAGIVVLFGL